MSSTLRKVAAAGAIGAASLAMANADDNFPDCGTSIRKAWEDLTCDERTAYLDAVRALKDAGRYGDFAEMHFGNSDRAHGAAVFLPWHRWFLWVFEKELQNISQSCITLPYWSWESDFGEPRVVEETWFSGLDGRDLPCDTIWANPNNARFCGDTRFNTGPDGLTTEDACCGCGGGIRDNSTGTETCTDFTVNATSSGHEPNPAIFHAGAFGSVFTESGRSCVFDGLAEKNWEPRRDDSGQGCLMRSFINGRMTPDTDEADIADLITQNTEFQDFRPAMEGTPHAAPHVWVGGSMETHFSPDDPLFFLHHTNVDRIWGLWQDFHDHDEVAFENFTFTHYSGRSFRGQGGIDDPMSFDDPLSLDFTIPEEGVPIENRSMPTPRDLLTLYDGLTSVTYANDQMARVLDGLYDSNPDWIDPAEGPATPKIPCQRNFTFPVESTVPEATSAVPEATSAVPEATSAVPQATSAVPQATSAVPQATSAVPEATSAVPEATAAPITPHTTKQEIAKAVRSNLHEFVDRLSNRALNLVCRNVDRFGSHKEFDLMDVSGRRRAFNWFGGRSSRIESLSEEPVLEPIRKAATESVFRNQRLNKIYSDLSTDFKTKDKTVLIHTLHSAKCAASGRPYKAPDSWIEMNNMVDQKEYFRCSMN